MTIDFSTHLQKRNYYYIYIMFYSAMSIYNFKLLPTVKKTVYHILNGYTVIIRTISSPHEMRVSLEAGGMHVRHLPLPSIAHTTTRDAKSRISCSLPFQPCFTTLFQSHPD